MHAKSIIFNWIYVLKIITKQKVIIAKCNLYLYNIITFFIIF